MDLNNDNIERVEKNIEKHSELEKNVDKDHQIEEGNTEEKKDLNYISVQKDIDTHNANIFHENNNLSSIGTEQEIEERDLIQEPYKLENKGNVDIKVNVDDKDNIVGTEKVGEIEELDVKTYVNDKEDVDEKLNLDNKTNLQEKSDADDKANQESNEKPNSEFKEKSNISGEVLNREDSSSEYIHDDTTKDNSNVNPKLETIKKENKEELEELKLKSFLTSITKIKEDGNKLFKNQDWFKAEECYRRGVDESEIFFQEHIENLNKYTIKYPQILEEINKQRKFLFSNLGNSLQKQKKHFEVYQIDTFIIANIDPNFDKSYIRLMNSALELNNLELAKHYETIFKSKFDQKTVDTHREFLSILETKIKEENDKKENSKPKMPNGESNLTTNANNLKEKEILDLSQDSVKTNTSKNSPKKEKKVSKRFKFSWRLILFPLVMVGGFASLYFLISRRNYFKK